LAKVETKKTQNVNKTTTNKQVGSLVLEIGIAAVAIDIHITIIQV